jgi:hypothetical protein
MQAVAASECRPIIARRAIVVFEDRTDLRWLRLLRQGFRHCFCLVGDELQWTVCDPLKSAIELHHVTGLSEAELAEHYRNTCRTVLLGQIGRATSHRYRCRLLTCVEIVKRVICLDAPSVVTPAQLYGQLLAGTSTMAAYSPYAGATAGHPNMLDSVFE